MQHAAPRAQPLAAALVFELSKVDTVAIRERAVTHLLNIDEGLAKSVAKGLGLAKMPKPADAARPLAPRMHERCNGDTVREYKLFQITQVI